MVHTTRMKLNAHHSKSKVYSKPSLTKGSHPIKESAQKHQRPSADPVSNVPSMNPMSQACTTYGMDSKDSVAIKVEKEFDRTQSLNTLQGNQQKNAPKTGADQHHSSSWSNDSNTHDQQTKMSCDDTQLPSELENEIERDMIVVTQQRWEGLSKGTRPFIVRQTKGGPKTDKEVRRQRAIDEKKHLPEMADRQRRQMIKTLREEAETHKKTAKTATTTDGTGDDEAVLVEVEGAAGTSPTVICTIWQTVKGVLSAIKEFAWIMTPPVPACAIPKMAFRPPKPTYSFALPNGSRMTRCPYQPLTFKGDALKFHMKYVDAEAPARAETSWIRTEKGSWVCWTMLQPEWRYDQEISKDCWGRYVIIYSHPNATDMGHHLFCWPTAENLANFFDATVVVYDYSGYGMSGGYASEKNLYADIKAVYNAVIQRCAGLDSKKIVLWGQSLGTAASVDLASKLTNTQMGGLILASAFTSALGIYMPSIDQQIKFPGDMLCSISKIDKVNVPVLILHGRDDRMMSWYHARRLYYRCKLAVPPLFIKGVGHNDIDLASDFWRRIKHYLKCELPYWQKSGCKRLLPPNDITTGRPMHKSDQSSH